MPGWVRATKIHARVLQSRFLELGAGARLEIMTRSDVVTRGPAEQLGLAHVAIAVGDEAAVDALAARFAAEGVAMVDGPRRTGDGYYECVVLRSGGQSRGNRGGLIHMKTAGDEALMILAVAAASPRGEPAVQTWPEITQTAKPWTRWWWPGSAVEREPLAAQLDANSRPPVSAAWRSRLSTARVAVSRATWSFYRPAGSRCSATRRARPRRLGLGVDMATGTGWPFGGPEVSVAQGSSTMALLDGRLAGKPTAMKVKRAAPGGEGLVLDPYSTDALDSYLERFTQRLARPAAAAACARQFHDSFEYYNASWSPTLPREFRALNGYDIQTYAREAHGRSAARCGHARPPQGRLPPHARQDASRLRERAG